MKCNVGTIDRVIRMIVGLALIAWALLFTGPVWAYLGVVPLLTGLIRWCPAYSLININTHQ